MAKQVSIFNFFKNKSSVSSDQTKGGNTQSSPVSSPSKSLITTCSSKGDAQSPEFYDLGTVNRETINDDVKLNILTKVWLPSPDYQFPQHFIGKVQRRFRPDYLYKFKWLRYSQTKNSVFCAPCTVFSRADSVFAQKGVQDWSNLNKLITKHSRSDEHNSSLLMAENFKKIAEGEKVGIDQQLSSILKQKIDRNRSILSSIIKIIIVCAKQNIALRGHVEQDSNFIALLQLRADTDPVLQNHLKYAPEHAKYLSPDIQNELINICGDYVRSQLVQECNNAPCFSLIADETTDCSTKEQISLNVRYVHRPAGQSVEVKEVFLGFVEAEGLTGNNLSFIGICIFFTSLSAKWK